MPGQSLFVSRCSDTCTPRDNLCRQSKMFVFFIFYHMDVDLCWIYPSVRACRGNDTLRTSVLCGWVEPADVAAATPEGLQTLGHIGWKAGLLVSDKNKLRFGSWLATLYVFFAASGSCVQIDYLNCDPVSRFPQPFIRLNCLEALTMVNWCMNRSVSIVAPFARTQTGCLENYLSSSSPTDVHLDFISRTPRVGTCTWCIFK